MEAKEKNLPGGLLKKLAAEETEVSEFTQATQQAREQVEKLRASPQAKPEEVSQANEALFRVSDNLNRSLRSYHQLQEQAEFLGKKLEAEEKVAQAALAAEGGEEEDARAREAKAKVDREWSAWEERAEHKSAAQRAREEWEDFRRLQRELQEKQAQLTTLEEQGGAAKEVRRLKKEISQLEDSQTDSLSAYQEAQGERWANVWRPERQTTPEAEVPPPEPSETIAPVSAPEAPTFEERPVPPPSAPPTSEPEVAEKSVNVHQLSRKLGTDREEMESLLHQVESKERKIGYLESHGASAEEIETAEDEHLALQARWEEVTERVEKNQARLGAAQEAAAAAKLEPEPEIPEPTDGELWGQYASGISTKQGQVEKDTDRIQDLEKQLRAYREQDAFEQIREAEREIVTLRQSRSAALREIEELKDQAATEVWEVGAAVTPVTKPKSEAEERLREKRAAAKEPEEIEAYDGKILRLDREINELDTGKRFDPQAEKARERLKIEEEAHRVLAAELTYEESELATLAEGSQNEEELKAAQLRVQDLRENLASSQEALGKRREEVTAAEKSTTESEKQTLFHERQEAQERLEKIARTIEEKEAAIAQVGNPLEVYRLRKEVADLGDSEEKAATVVETYQQKIDLEVAEKQARRGQLEFEKEQIMQEKGEEELAWAQQSLKEARETGSPAEVAAAEKKVVQLQSLAADSRQRVADTEAWAEALRDNREQKAQEQLAAQQVERGWSVGDRTYQETSLATKATVEAEMAQGETQLGKLREEGGDPQAIAALEKRLATQKEYHQQLVVNEIIPKAGGEVLQDLVPDARLVNKKGEAISGRTTARMIHAHGLLNREGDWSKEVFFPNQKDAEAVRASEEKRQRAEADISRALHQEQIGRSLHAWEEKTVRQALGGRAKSEEVETWAKRGILDEGARQRLAKDLSDQYFDLLKKGSPEAEAKARVLENLGKKASQLSETTGVKTRVQAVAEATGRKSDREMVTGSLQSSWRDLPQGLSKKIDPPPKVSLQAQALVGGGEAPVAGVKINNDFYTLKPAFKQSLFQAKKLANEAQFGESLDKWYSTWQRNPTEATCSLLFGKDATDVLYGRNLSNVLPMPIQRFVNPGKFLVSEETQRALSAWQDYQKTGAFRFIIARTIGQDLGLYQKIAIVKGGRVVGYRFVAAPKVWLSRGLGAVMKSPFRIPGGMLTNLFGDHKDEKTGKQVFNTFLGKFAISKDFLAIAKILQDPLKGGLLPWGAKLAVAVVKVPVSLAFYIARGIWKGTAQLRSVLVTVIGSLIPAKLRLLAVKAYLAFSNTRLGGAITRFTSRVFGSLRNRFKKAFDVVNNSRVIYLLRLFRWRSQSIVLGSLPKLRSGMVKLFWLDPNKGLSGLLRRSSSGLFKVGSGILGVLKGELNLQTLMAAIINKVAQVAKAALASVAKAIGVSLGWVLAGCACVGCLVVLLILLVIFIILGYCPYFPDFFLCRYFFGWKPKALAPPPAALQIMVGNPPSFSLNDPLAVGGTVLPVVVKNTSSGPVMVAGLTASMSYITAGVGRGAANFAAIKTGAEGWGSFTLSNSQISESLVDPKTRYVSANNVVLSPSEQADFVLRISSLKTDQDATYLTDLRFLFFEGADSTLPLQETHGIVEIRIGAGVSFGDDLFVQKINSLATCVSSDNVAYRVFSQECVPECAASLWNPWFNNLQCAVFIEGGQNCAGIKPIFGDAYQWFGIASRREDMAVYTNGAQCPRRGDVIVWEGGSQGWGHVAVVTDDGGLDRYDCSGRVEITQANTPRIKMNLNVYQGWVTAEGFEAAGFSLLGLVRRVVF